MSKLCRNGQATFYQTMKFKFKIQAYLIEGVKNTTDIFIGQPNRDPSKYRRDLDRLDSTMQELIDDDGYRNADVELSSTFRFEILRDSPHEARHCIKD